MKNTITLNRTVTHQENPTSKYWRTIESQPQTTELKSWSTGHPYFILKGIIINSHDKNEIGKQVDNPMQTYSFYLDAEIKKGTYSIQ